MTDPYKVLGVSPSATDEQIKEAYRNLAKKYHPDQYADSPLKELADEKMKEINEAYDTVVNQRKQGGTGRQSAYTGGYNHVNTNGQSDFKDVRQLIMTGRFADAEQILNGVPVQSRNAEWYFLKGSVLYRRGWLDEAREHFSQACRLDPGNAEYSAAFNQASSQRSGVYGGYNPQANPNVGGCNSCDICSGLLMADCCCECMGGDLIPCC